MTAVWLLGLFYPVRQLKYKTILLLQYSNTLDRPNMDHLLSCQLSSKCLFVFVFYFRVSLLKPFDIASLSFLPDILIVKLRLLTLKVAQIMSFFLPNLIPH